MRYKELIKFDQGRIQNTLSGEVSKINHSYKGYFASLQALIQVFVYMSFAFFVNMHFAILVTIGGLITNLIYKGIYKKTIRASHKVTTLSNTFEGFLVQLVTNLKYFKATGLIKKYQTKLDDAVRGIEEENRIIGMLASILTAAREPILIVVVSAVILIQNQVLGAPLGPILISLLFFYRSLSYLMVMQNSWNQFMSLSGSLQNMTTFRENLSIAKETDGTTPYLSLEAGIVARDLSFDYSDATVIKGVNLEIRKNQTVAIVGESGSGKTTLVNLIAGLFLPTAGELSIGGVNSEELEKKGYQERVGYITQEPVIFNDSIFNNVSFWDEPNESNLIRFEQALKKAAIMDFVNEQREGKNTLLGSNGINLSGGQKQRISIARELYKEIDLLIMDEATSALDSKTELEIQENISSLKGTFTMIIIAHRLSTIRNADLIVLMDAGEIVNVGTFTELVDSSELFKEMVQLQKIK